MAEAQPAAKAFVPREVPTAFNPLIEDVSNGEIILKSGAITRPVFVREGVTFSGPKDGPRPQISLAWLTVSSRGRGQVVFKNIDFKCKLQVTAHSTIVAENCSFEVISDNCETAIEIFSESSATLKNCTLRHGTKTVLAFRDRSSGWIEGCTFEDNKDACVFLLGESCATIKNCRFGAVERWGVYAYRKSLCLIEDCEFGPNHGKGVYVLSDSAVRATKCTFKDCAAGGVLAADNSMISLEECHFEGNGSSCVHCVKNSDARLSECTFRDGRGNGIDFDYATGWLHKCTFENFKSPAIGIYGCQSNPVIWDCDVIAVSGIAIAVRDAAVPVIDNVRIRQSRGAQPVFSISDFASPIVTKCSVQRCDGCVFSVYNKASPELIGNNIEPPEKGETICLFTGGDPTFMGNTFVGHDCVIRDLSGRALPKDQFVGNVFAVDEKAKRYQIKLTERNECEITEKIVEVVDDSFDYPKDPWKDIDEGSVVMPSPAPLGEAPSRGKSGLLSRDSSAENALQSQRPEGQLDGRFVSGPGGMACVANPSREIGDRGGGGGPVVWGGGSLLRRENPPTSLAGPAGFSFGLGRMVSIANPSREESGCGVDRLSRELSRGGGLLRPDNPPPSAAPPDQPLASLPMRRTSGLSRTPSVANPGRDPSFAAELSRSDAAPQRQDDLHFVVDSDNPLFSSSPSQVTRMTCATSNPTRGDSGRRVAGNGTETAAGVKQDPYLLATGELFAKTKPFRLPQIRPPPGMKEKQKHLDVEGQWAVDLSDGWEQPQEVPCFYCHRRPAACYLAPCGHRVICAECREEFKNQAPEAKRHWRCPLCCVPVKEAVQSYEEEWCVICLSAKPDTIFLTCGHQCTCYSCALRVWWEKRQCPICQARFISYRQVFPLENEAESLDGKELS